MKQGIDLKILFPLLIFGIIIFSTGAYGQNFSEIGYRLVPNKIMENTEGVLQVYAVNGTGSNIIGNLIATSSDSTIIQILKIEQEKNGFITDVRIKAVAEGTAKIALAAPGFSSQETAITVYKDSDTPVKLLIKTTPDVFTTTGPKQGYVSVELTNNDDFPTKALVDTVVTLSTSNSDVVILQNPQLIIKKGEYFATDQFEVKQNGDVSISASSSSMQTVSSKISVSSTPPKIIQAYVFPNKTSSSIATYAYVVVQLHDSDGIPIQATEDIPVRVQVTNASGTELKNTSGEVQQISANSPLVIKNGSYWGYVPLAVNSGLNGNWSIGISAKGYQVSGLVNMTTTTVGKLDVNTAKVDALPVLATGGQELIGILHLQDKDANPVLSSQNLQIKIDSSEPNTLSVDDVKLDKGASAAPVFGTVGKNPSNTTALNVITEPAQTINPVVSEMTGVGTLQLAAEPLIPKILSNSNFPLLLFIKKDGALTYSTEELNPLISPKESIQSESKIFPKGQPLMLLNSNLLKEGSSAISVTAGSYVNNISLDGLSAKPASLLLDHPDKILTNAKNTFSVELLDDKKNPVFANKDLELRLVSNDPSILNVPSSVVIPKGSYYSSFNVDAKNSGNVEIAVLTSDLPLSKFGLNVTSLNPVINIVSNDYVNPNSSLDASLSAVYQGAPLSGLKVNWVVSGAKIEKMDSVTNSEGKAALSIISEDPNTIKIDASVSGGLYEITTVSKSIKVNPPLEQPSTQTGDGMSAFSIMGINLLFIILPVGAAVGGIVLKKKNMLEGISEKLGIEDRFEGIKEKISEMREK